MSNFTASNGFEIEEITPTAGLYVNKVPFYIQPAQMVALREYFLAERDQELGRWRWPENPDYVVYPKQPTETDEDPGVRVVHDETGRSRDINKSVVGACDAVLSTFGRAARAYFAAHPEPKPWHAAKQNELWELQIEHRLDPEVYRFAQDTTCADSKVFRPVNNPKRVFYDPKSPLITSARRIWPESKES